MEINTESEPKINIFALPNQTSIIFGLIVTVIAGTLIMGYTITAAPIVWLFAFVFIVLPFRAFIARPEREFSRYNCVESPDDFAGLQKEINSLASRMGLSRSLRLIVKHKPDKIYTFKIFRYCFFVVDKNLVERLKEISEDKMFAFWIFHRRLVMIDIDVVDENHGDISKIILKNDEIYTFGTFRHWFIVIDKDHADICKARLEELETAPIVQAELIHELSHFKAGDYWQLGYVRELLRIIALFMLWAFVYLLGYGILLSALKKHIAQADMTEWIKQAPVMFQGILQSFNIMGMVEIFCQKLEKADLLQILLFNVSATYPFVIVSLFLWGIYCPKLWRVREFYADAGVVHVQREVKALLSARTGIPLPYLNNFKSSSEDKHTIWHTIKQLIKYHPDDTTRINAIYKPSIAFDNSGETAILAGTLAFLLEVLLNTPLTIAGVGKLPMHFPTIGIIVLISLNYLIPHIAQGKAVKGGIFKIIFVIIFSRLFILIFSTILLRYNSGFFEYVIQNSKEPLFRNINDFIAQIVLSNLTQIFIISVVLWGALILAAFLLRRIFIWYAFLQPQARLMKISYVTIAGVCVFIGFTVLPLVTEIALYCFPSLFLPHSDIVIAISGFVLTIIGVIVFWRTDRKYAHHCPDCGQMVDGSYELGKSCCGKLLHQWLIAEYRI